MSVWDYTEEAPRNVEAVRDLWSWGLNFGHGDAGNPWVAFLDLTGISVDELGDTIGQKVETLGFVELDYLADALRQYANNPQAVREWVAGLWASEMEPDA